MTITGDTPSKKNSRNIFCRGGFPVNIPNQRYKDWHEAGMWQLKAQKIKPIASGTVMVNITIYPKTKRASDLTNKSESCMDLLVDAGILPDDNWFIVQQVILTFGGVDKDNPRAEVEIVEL